MLAAEIPVVFFSFDNDFIEKFSNKVILITDGQVTIEKKQLSAKECEFNVRNKTNTNPLNIENFINNLFMLRLLISNF